MLLRRSASLAHIGYRLIIEKLSVLRRCVYQIVPELEMDPKQHSY